MLDGMPFPTLLLAGSRPVAPACQGNVLPGAYPGVCLRASARLHTPFRVEEFGV